MTNVDSETVKHHRVCNLYEAMCEFEATLKHTEQNSEDDIVVKLDKNDTFS